MAREALIAILLFAGHLFTATDGTGDSISGSWAIPEITCRGERSLVGNGFHRDLNTQLVITARKNVRLQTQCEILLIENLSPSFYVDPYQIETAQEFGGPKVFSYDDIDLEKPEFLSPPLTLYVFHQLVLHGNVLSSNVTLPLHVRYHSPFDDFSHVPVEVTLPGVFVACRPDADWLKSFETTWAPCSKDTSIRCIWMKVSCTFPEKSLRFNVPVGNLLHLPVITLLTFLIITISTCAFCVKFFLGIRNTVPSSTAPSSTVPSSTVPVNTVPSSTAPNNTVPSSTADVKKHS